METVIGDLLVEPSSDPSISKYTSIGAGLHLTSRKVQLSTKY